MQSASFAAYLIIVIIIHFYTPLLNATPSVDNNMLIAFMKGHQQAQISEYSAHKFEAHLGIVHFMIKNWQCDKISEKFEEYERGECQKYQKYLNILYEYLFREYVGEVPTVKPKFVLHKNKLEIEGPIIYAVNCLTKISQFYFHKYGEVMMYERKLNNLFFTYHFEPKLLNEHRLNYNVKLVNEKPKVPINEMILQLAIDTAYGCQTNESVDGIFRQNFNEFLGKMFKKAEQRAKREDNYLLNVKYGIFDTYDIIVRSIFDDYFVWTDDAIFTEFVKGQETNFEKFYRMLKEYSNFEKSKEFYLQKYGAYFGLVYLMRKNWQCAKVGEDLKEKCQKYKKYLHILYEYFFRISAEAKNPNMTNQLPAVKPIFKCGNKYWELMQIIFIIQNMNNFSKCFWKKGEKECENAYGNFEMELQNEKETNHAIEEEEKNGQNLERKSEKQSTEIGKLRTEFDQKMEEIYENTKEKVAEDKAKLEKEKALAKVPNDLEIKKMEKKYEQIFAATEIAAEKKSKLVKKMAKLAINRERKMMEDEFEEKFGAFNSSPFAEANSRLIQIKKGI